MSTPWDEFGVSYDRRFLAWLHSLGSVLVVSAYRPGGAIALGPRKDGSDLFAYVHPMARPMALASAGPPAVLWTSDMHRVMRWEPVDVQGTRYLREVRSWATGDLDIHDFTWNEELELSGSREPLGLSTLYNGIVDYERGSGSALVWRCPLVAQTIAEDRVHLNGVHGEWATVCGTEDASEGWRRDREGGGALLRDGLVALGGLSMPHSPVSAGDGGCYLLESGRGRLLHHDGQIPARVVVDGLPGFARGLTILGRYAVLTLSKPRDGDSVFSGLPLEVENPVCGVHVYDLDSGALVTWCRFEGVQEVFDAVPVLGFCHTRMANAGDPATAFELNVRDEVG